MEIIYPGLLWLIVGVILFLMEMAVTSFVLFFFGLGAWITALACWFFPLSINNQLALFLCSSLATLFGLRGIVKKVFIGDARGDSLDSVIARGGEKCVVITAINPPAEGHVKFSGSFWRAEADEAIGEGETVTIIRQDNLLLKVKKI
ncbi:MAG: NfeD family protein [Proteobacteria bacterium]|nr:NfeD family protein [Pseudomonadota bacterium]MBU1057771.1 NfeD family protein [Pseudomonadota bacterium]